MQILFYLVSKLLIFNIMSLNFEGGNDNCQNFNLKIYFTDWKNNKEYYNIYDILQITFI